MYSIEDYDYQLPPTLIAAKPLGQRDKSRLMRIRRSGGGIEHRLFDEITDLLEPGDLLVLNNTRVVPARILGYKPSGGRVEALILDYVGGMQRLEESGVFESTCLVRASKAPRVGSRLHFEPGLEAEVVAQEEQGRFLRLRFAGPADLAHWLDQHGHPPLPPYILSARQEISDHDRRRYQTVYAQQSGAVAAPTAGLHFTRRLLERLTQMGIDQVYLTLHVGYGTFSPVRVNDIRSHQMHAERFQISEETALAINHRKLQGGRVVAVGTTALRTLEYAAGVGGQIEATSGWCNLFIYPGYRFKVVDGLITNFHLPKSTLMMLVSALAGRELIVDAYKAAIAAEYRFYSYGDAMLIQ